MVALRNQFPSAYGAGMGVLTDSWTIEVNAWTLALRAVGRPETTIRTRTDHVRWLGKWAGERGPWSLSLDDLLEFMGGRVWAAETRRGVRSSLRGFWRWGVQSDRTLVDVALSLPSVKPGQPRPHPTPEAAYRRAVLAAAPRERLMLRLAAEVGLRRAEVAQVSSRDLLDDLGGLSLLVHGKGSRERIMPLPTSLGAELRSLPGGFAFPGADHGHLSPRWVGKIVGRLLPDGYTMHSLRHRFGTRAYALSKDMFTVQELLGHASPVTTRTYVLLEDSAKRSVIDQLAEAS